MSNRTKLVSSATIVGIVGLVGLGFAFYFTEDKVGVTSSSQVAARTESSAPDRPGSLTEQPVGTDNRTSGRNDFRSEQTAPTTGIANSRSDSDKIVSDGTTTSVSRNQPGTVSARDPELDWAHVPVAFMNYGGILPSTPEVAAAIQHIQDEFVSATGAGTVNPADPGFSQAWQWAQPTADEEFYALFGVEAFNALSIMEARQRGHF